MSDDSTSLSPHEWEFTLQQIETEELVPCKQSPLFEDGWQPQILGNTFAIVRLHRKDGSDVGSILNQHFQVEHLRYRILRVLESEGPSALVRCQALIKRR
jgi:hypothetical protein